MTLINKTGIVHPIPILKLSAQKSSRMAALGWLDVHFDIGTLDSGDILGPTKTA